MGLRLTNRPGSLRVPGSLALASAVTYGVGGFLLGGYSARAGALGLVLFGERLGRWQLLGVVLIITGLVLIGLG